MYNFLNLLLCNLFFTRRYKERFILAFMNFNIL